MELTDTASQYINSVAANTCLRSAFNNADVIILHDNDAQVCVHLLSQWVGLTRRFGWDGSGREWVRNFCF